MKSMTKCLVGLVLLAFVSQVMAEKKPSVKEYRQAMNNLYTSFSHFDIDRRIQLYQTVEKITRIAWEGLQSKFINKRSVSLSQGRYEMAFYDFDKDHLPDQFRLSTEEGKAMPQDFGFIYDLNQDKRFDYIVYFGGSMITNDGDINYYFYHWLDTDYDGKIDAVANAIFIHPKETRPDPERIFWVMDLDKNGKPDHVDFTEIKSGEKIQLTPEDGIWHYNTLFGAKEIDAAKEGYFDAYSEYLEAINGRAGD